MRPSRDTKELQHTKEVADILVEYLGMGIFIAAEIIQRHRKGVWTGRKESVEKSEATLTSIGNHTKPVKIYP